MVVEVVQPNKEQFEGSDTKLDHEFGNPPILAPPPRDRFLVSFLVDARGGSMRGSRHPGLRVLVPPSAASAPTRVTCRMLRPERTTRPPQLNDSEGLACRIIELGPYPCTFNTPVLLEIPHFASLRGRQRELVVLRSDNGETWREHSLEATDQAVQSALGQNFDTLETLEELREKRIIRILTNDFPQYLAVVSRLRQETAMIGSDGGVLSSTVVPQVQAVFPEGALQKRIRVGLQTLECQEGFEVCAASPEVEVVEGRPAWLDAAGNLLPVAKAGEQLNLMFNAFRENRLAFPVRVRDIQAEPTGKLAFMREPRTPIKATQQGGGGHHNVEEPDSTNRTQGMITWLSSVHIPQKPICTLEVNIGLDQSQPAANSTMVDLGLLSLSEQLNTSVAATSAHSIPCVFPQPHTVDHPGQVGEIGDVRGKSLYGSENRLASVYAADVIARSQLDLLQVASEVGADWPLLVGVLLPESHLDTMCTVEQLVDWITQNEPRWAEAREIRGAAGDGVGAGGFAGLTVADLRTDRDQALAVLLSWQEQRGELATGNELDRALRAIGRVDVVKSCMRDIQCVTEEEEHAQASKLIDQPLAREQGQLVSSEPD
ncbi:hypothetical protein AHF37_00479 [Paragonimus kellicotti]|nr:hypothetical protein AHF37_00479 [Paragonimus kellicotti]